MLLIDVQRLDRRDLIYTAVSRLTSLPGEPPELPVPRRVVSASGDAALSAQATKTGQAHATDGRTPAGHGPWKPSDARGLTSIREIVERKGERSKGK